MAFQEKKYKRNNSSLDVQFVKLWVPPASRIFISMTVFLLTLKPILNILIIINIL